MYDAELAFARQLALKAGGLMRSYSSSIRVETKSDNSPVTQADKAVNDLVIDEVKAVFPAHGVIGEEASDYQDGQEFVWSCDPIDGTIAYITHFPTSMFSLALLKDGVPIVAATYNPWTNELFTAQKGSGTFLNDNQIYVSKRPIENGTVIVAGTLSQDKLDIVQRIRSGLPTTTHTNAVIGAVFAGTRVAAGDAEGYVFYYKGAHDMSAVQLLVEEAGGKVTDLDGKSQKYDQPINGALVSNGIIHDRLKGLL